MRTIVLNDVLASLAANSGRTKFTVSLPVSAAESLADHEDFLLMVEHERPITGGHLYDAVVAAYGRLITNDRTAREDGTFAYDADTGPVVSVLSLYRVEGEIELIRPSASDKRAFKKDKGRDMMVETLPAVVVQSRHRWRAALPEDVRGLFAIDVPKAWSDAADQRAQQATPALTAAPEPEPLISDVRASRMLFEDKATRGSIAGPFPKIGDPSIVCEGCGVQTFVERETGETCQLCSECAMSGAPVQE